MLKNFKNHFPSHKKKEKKNPFFVKENEEYIF